MTVYMGLIHKSSTGYDITFPDALGCTASADTLDKIMKEGTHALRIWAEEMRASGKAVPAPRSPAQIENDPDVAQDIADGAMRSLFVMTANEGARSRVNITFDTGLLAAVDEAAKMRDQTRSEFLEWAARDKITVGGVQAEDWVRMASADPRPLKSASDKRTRHVPGKIGVSKTKRKPPKATG